MNNTYTLQQIKDAVMEILQNEKYINEFGIIASCEKAATKCFVEEIPENNTTKFIRQALIDLSLLGHFNLTNYNK